MRAQSVPHSFVKQIVAEKTELEEQASRLPPSPQKYTLLKKIRQLETAARVDGWLASPGLRPPT